MTKNQSFGKLGITLLGAVLLVVILVLGFRYLSQGSLRADIPPLAELQRYPRAVQEQLTQADAEARSKPGSGKAVGGLAVAYHANSFHEQARVCYQLAMRVDGKNPLWPYYLGYLEQTAGQNERAITFLTKAVELDGSNTNAWARLAEIYFRRQAWDDALRTARRALDLNRTHTHAGVVAARVLGQRGDWAGAAKVLEPCVAAHPVYGPGQRMLALIYAELGRTDEQKRHEEMGSDIGLQIEDPLIEELFLQSSTGSVLVTHAQIAQSWGAMQRAEKFLRRALQTSAQEKDVRLALGRFLALPGNTSPARLKEAKEHLAMGIQIDPGYMGTRHEYASVLQALGDTAAAAAEWERIVREEPQHAMAWMSLGQLEMVRENYARALDLFQRGLSIPPDTPFSLGEPWMGHHRVALTYWKMGRAQDAGKSFSRCEESNPRFPELYIDWARFEKEMGRPDEGARIYARGVGRNPDNGILRLAFGNYLQQVSRFAEAKDQLEAAARLLPNDPRALTALGYVKLQTGDPDGAIRDLESAIAADRNFPLAYYHMGNALLAKGMREDAVRNFEMALRIQPGLIPARQALEKLRAN